jgi:hypothetical protein
MQRYLDFESRYANKEEKTYANARKVIKSLSLHKPNNLKRKRKEGRKKKQQDLSSFSYCMVVSSM